MSGQDPVHEALWRGRDAVSRGEYVAAQRWFERSLRLDPDIASAMLALATQKLRQHP